MPRRDPDLLIEDILTAIGKIERYTTGMDQGQFQQDEKTLDAVVRNLEIVGEAARQLPEEFAAQYPELLPLGWHLCWWRSASLIRQRRPERPGGPSPQGLRDTGKGG
jgi:hypothetical protein